MRAPLSILVVEDEVEIATAVSAALRDDGHHVELALDPEAAVRIAYRLVPDAVVFDLDLGPELARSLRVDVLAASTSMIAIGTPTATVDVELDLVLQKPVDLSKLGSLVEYITQRRQQARR